MWPVSGAALALAGAVRARRPRQGRQAPWALARRLPVSQGPDGLAGEPPDGQAQPPGGRASRLLPVRCARELRAPPQAELGRADGREPWAVAEWGWRARYPGSGWDQPQAAEWAMIAQAARRGQAEQGLRPRGRRQQRTAALLPVWPLRAPVVHAPALLLEAAGAPPHGEPRSPRVLWAQRRAWRPPGLSWSAVRGRSGRHPHR